MSLIFEEETYAIIGAAMDVHKELGNGFLEAVYQEALAIEFVNRKIHVKRESPLKIHYKNRQLSKVYIADFICYDKIIVELKAVSHLSVEHEAQLLNYLKATKLKLGLLINFGAKSLEHKRMVL